MHVVAAPARNAMAACYEGMTDDCVPNLDSLYILADRFDPTGILVPHDVGQIDVDLAAPDALDDMEIRAADPRAADANDHLRGAANRRVRDILVFDKLLRRQLFVVCVQDSRFHFMPPRLVSVAKGVGAVERQP